MGNQHPSREKRKVQRLKSLKSQGSGVALAKEQDIVWSLWKHKAVERRVRCCVSVFNERNNIIKKMKQCNVKLQLIL